MRVFCSAVLVLLGFAAGAGAQDLDLSITDPDEIAAQCGGSADVGELLFATCAGCHALTPDEGVGQVGPHFYGLFGRTAASVEDFPYSETLRQTGADGLFWERETLHALLEGKGPIDGHDLLENEQARMDLLTYVRINTQLPPPAIGEVEVPDAVLTMSPDIPYGEYLASECAGCHAKGSGNIPQIDGLDTTYFITAMFEYRARARSNESMQLIAARLSDEEIAHVAGFYAQN